MPLHSCASVPGPDVVQPHQRWEDETHGRKAHRARKRENVIEDGDRRREYTKARNPKEMSSPNHSDQCCHVLDWKCDELRRRRTKAYLAAAWLKMPALTIKLGSAMPYATLFTNGPALPSDGVAIHRPQ